MHSRLSDPAQVAFFPLAAKRRKENARDAAILVFPVCQPPGGADRCVSNCTLPARTRPDVLDIDTFVATYLDNEADPLRFFTTKNAQYEHKGTPWLLLDNPMPRSHA